jgi:hypothetical protein
MSKTEKNLQKNFEVPAASAEDIFHCIEKICEGLVYISEIDSAVTAFLSRPASSSFPEEIDIRPDETVREVDFGSFFDRLTMPKDWHGEPEAVRTKKFLDLRKLIEENLIEPKVFKIGDTHVRFVAAGLATDGRTVGISMRALET